MMHEVLLTARAQDELERNHNWWAAKRSADQANRWYTGFIQLMLTLQNKPERCPLALENELLPIQVRQLNYGLGAKPTHRALYTVRADTVVILRVRHLAQQPLSSEDL
jgi:plasmid stabilization system protein ParE